MNRLERRLLVWAEDRLGLDDLAVTIEELFEDRRSADGARAAGRWRRREIRRAVLRALFSPASRAADRNLLEVIARELRFALRRVGRLPGHALSFAAIVGTGIGISVFMAVLALPPVVDPRSPHPVHRPNGRGRGPPPASV